jgi:hypothetical protein
MQVESDRRARRRRLTEQTIIVAFSLIMSLAFCNKAFHIDDPLYLSIARQILAHPLHPFDGEINWQQITQPAWEVSISPPGYSYWLAAWMAIGVESEWGLHLAGSFWAVVLGLATYDWARRLGDWALEATLLVLSSPLVIAGQNLMLDVPMLALATAAIAVYHRASDQNSVGLAVLAGLLAGISVNVKYAGVVAIGVMAVDAILWRRGRLLIGAVVAITLLVAGQMTLASRDGVPQLLFARTWIARLWPSDARDILHRVSTSLLYLGGSAAWLLLLWGTWRRGAAWCLAVIALCAAASLLAILDLRSLEPTASMMPLVHACIFAFNGTAIFIALLLLCVQNAGNGALRRWLLELRGGGLGSPIRQGVILVVWTAGFWYLGVLNGPFVAPRALVPCLLSLALSVLAISPSPDQAGRTVIRSAVAITLAFGLLVGVGDYRWAGIYRERASELVQKYRAHGGTLYFLGHWGWQHYAAEAGMIQFDPIRTRIRHGDTIIWPKHVDCPLPMSPILRRCPEVAREQVEISPWLPRTRSPSGNIFLHGDTNHGRIPWGWSKGGDPLEVFLILRCAE